MTDTTKYKLNHSMIRIKDPKITVPFYENNFGMKLIHKAENADAKFDLYFLAFDSPSALHSGKARSDREGILELTHNYGSEDKDGKVYHNGNKEPQGFGHICFTVDNISGACQALESKGVKFQKKQTDGRQKDIAFALDPDEYWIELVGHGKDDASAKSDIGSYRFNHTMIRIKDPAVSLKFYTEIMGMELLRKSEMKDAKFDLYFLAYPQAKSEENSTQSGLNPGAAREGILELTHNYGSEEKEGQVYHNGNDEPQGFGHIAVSVDNLDAACERFEQKGVNWKKRLTDGRMKTIAFILDPDNYWIEIIGNETLKK
ncbi:Lactoylglutathione lyase [Taphrina deformans PYCC 5710]|uniref:Lactoylglutathione lyase n=1 Tax=Taphrina deformans (strain PYCC 5710 / ATCC 11124 / CBS 356.35 / IMI 108563 / JCM 9778 / NBRC 8474) TaxID=1097556 RepID=R4X893_TAPDE|nr:Lactoylglutathione lyase [Taphrina deformans PYCC 5710]|eukprot:CCG81769.1 Lactoylglutathione lyase [Taphrina deformans PYCC 5710]